MQRQGTRPQLPPQLPKCSFPARSPPVRSATSEKSENRLRPPLRMPCLPSSIRWAGLRRGELRATQLGERLARGRGAPATSSSSSSLRPTRQSQPAAQQAHTTHMTICLRIMSAKHSMALLGSCLQQRNREARAAKVQAG